VEKEKISIIKPALVIGAIVAFITIALIYRRTGNDFYGTFWALIPPLIAIALALITKEVYSSLFVGILAGAMLYADFSPEGTLNTIFVDGFIERLVSEWRIGVLIFLVLLGIMVCLVSMSGGSAAYAKWASKKIKTRTGAQLATIGLGVLLFIDDYFNCLTVGNVMRPVTDKFKVSRAKLAYIVDTTAAPICIIAPISSWAAAVSGSLGDDMEVSGFIWFIRSIPYNFYAILSIVVMIAVVVLKYNIGPMRTHELNAELHGDLYTEPERPYANADEEVVSERGGIIDMVIPILALIVGCIFGMMYTGGVFEGAGIINSFADADAALGLTLGAFLALMVTFILFMARRVMSYKTFCSAITKGFIAMAPAILILTFAWTIKRMTTLLGSSEFVEMVMANSTGVLNFVPAIAFLVACGISFAIGTSWGTFGILLPIVYAVLDPSSPLMAIGISACLAGAVFGDHCTIISDTTIMASAGSHCDLMPHVKTQIPYALIVAAISLVMYVIAGFVQSWYIMLPLSIAATLLVLFAIKMLLPSKQAT